MLTVFNMWSIILSSQIHHFLDFVKQIYKDLPKVVVSTTKECVWLFQQWSCLSICGYFMLEALINLPSSSLHCLSSFPLVFVLITLKSFIFFNHVLCFFFSLQARYFENPQVIAENTVPSPEMVGMITSVLVKTAPEREDSETRTVSSWLVCCYISFFLLQYCF